MRKGWEESQDFPRKTFCLTVAKIFLGGNPLVLHFFRVWKKFPLERAGKESRFFVEKISSHSAKKTSQGTFLCCASEVSGSEKVYG